MAFYRYRMRLHHCNLVWQGRSRSLWLCSAGLGVWRYLTLIYGCCAPVGYVKVSCLNVLLILVIGGALLHMRPAISSLCIGPGPKPEVEKSGTSSFGE